MRAAAYGIAGGLIVALAACGGGGEPTPGDGAATTAPSVDGTVTVFAAASLTDAFEQLATGLEADHPGLDVVFSFGPSSGLAEQVVAGAPADVLATADTTTMDEAVAGGVVDGEPEIFARNTVVIAVPAGNPGNVTGLADLSGDELRIALCEPQVPCGSAAQRLLDLVAVTARPDTLATDVKEATSLVALGEVDAALVYRTDAMATDGVELVEVDEAADVVNSYAVAALGDAPNPEAARVFVEAVTGAAGRDVLTAAGFVEP